MTSYRINPYKPVCSCDVKTGDIYLGMRDNILSEDETATYIADSLIHEHVHKILFDWFDRTTSKLFDGIQQHFRNTTVHEKLLNDAPGQETYHKYIERKGFKAFLNYYDIDNDEFNQACALCNNRGSG